nr:MyoC [Craspedostauros australis]
MGEKKSQYVFIRDPEYAWIPAQTVDDDGKKAQVRVPQYPDEQSIVCDGGASAAKFEDDEVPLKDYNRGVLPMQNVDGSGNLRAFPDMVELPFLHEPAILFNLKERHGSGKPYTRTGDIIIAVNPFQWFKEIYTEKVRNRYARILVWENVDGDQRSQVEPHVYETSALAYNGLAFGGNDQSILVSGESGAGKTETVKICMNHIASCQQGPTAKGGGNNVVVNRVLESNPLLEAFGNAKTRRNDNSSRFGKYCQLQFDMGTKAEQEFRGRDKATCVLAGSKCDVYLLEKNRVVMHDPEERTYHIFYQIIASKHKTKYWSHLAGTTNESFRFVGKAPTDTIEGMKDGDHFNETVKVLEKVGVKDDNLMTLMQAIIIVLQIGNLTFGPDPKDDERSVVTSTKDFAALSEIMCVPEEAMECSFTERTMKTRNETYKVPLNATVAKESAEAFAKEIYGRLFLWLVRAINDATSAELNYKSGLMEHFGVIGLLDIFGFESFVRNRFEQLCINYANEKLQAKFTEDIFRSVQDEYEKEGIPLDEIKYDDNTDVLDLIEGKTGLLAMLNEECVRPKGTDQAFVTKALAANKQSPCLFPNKVNRMGFGIHHYAGKVMYDAEEFVIRNQDTLPTDLSDLASLCSNEIIAKHMTNDSCTNFESKTKSAQVAKKAPPKRAKSNLVAATVWAKYKTQLMSLMNMLKTTESKYIRCIKPNAPKKPLLMQHLSTIEQLRCAGVVAAVTLSRSAFPNRLENSVVRFKFWQMWDKEKYPSEGTASMSPEEKLTWDCRALLKCALAPLAENDPKTGKPVTVFVCGKTRSYFKMGALEYLESHRSAGLEVHAIQMQRLARGFLTRKRLRGSQKARKHGVNMIQKWMRAMIAKMKAKKEVEKARKEMLKREAKLKKQREEEAWKRKLEAEIAEREGSAKREYKKYEDRVEELKVQLKEAEARADERREEGQERINAAREEAEDLKEKLETEIKINAAEPAKLAAAQKTKLEESAKLIAFLQKENKKLKSANDKAKKEMKKVKETNTRLIQANESAGSSFEMLNNQSKKLNNNTSNLTGNIEKYKKANTKLRDDLKSRQAFYNTEAKIRLQYQKTMAQILDVFQDNCKDADLVEDIVCIALECESEAKAALAAAEASAPGL